MIGKRITIERLAMMIQTGFADIYERLELMATKEDLERFATKEDLKNLRFEFKEDILDTEERINIRINLLEDIIQNSKNKFKLA